MTKFNFSILIDVALGLCSFDIWCWYRIIVHLLGFQTFTCKRTAWSMFVRSRWNINIIVTGHLSQWGQWRHHSWRNGPTLITPMFKSSTFPSLSFHGFLPALSVCHVRRFRSWVAVWGHLISHCFCFLISHFSKSCWKMNDFLFRLDLSVTEEIHGTICHSNK